MRLHALQREAVCAFAGEVNWTTGGNVAAFYFASRPEAVEHLTPWVLWISAEVCGTIFAAHKCRCGLRYPYVNNALCASRRLECVGVAILRQLEGDIIGIEVELVVRDAVVRERVRGKEGSGGAVGVEDLGAELTRRLDAPSTCQPTTTTLVAKKITHITTLYMI